MVTDNFSRSDRVTQVRIDPKDAHLWDVASTMRRHGMTFKVVGLSRASAVLVDRHAPLMRDVTA